MNIFAELEYEGQLAYLSGMTFYSDNSWLKKELTIIGAVHNPKENEYYPLEQLRKLHRIQMRLPGVKITVLQELKFEPNTIY